MATVASRKARGAATERTVAAAWQADGWPHAEVVRGQGRDLTGTPGVAVRVVDASKPGGNDGRH